MNGQNIVQIKNKGEWIMKILNPLVTKLLLRREFLII